MRLKCYTNNQETDSFLRLVQRKAHDVKLLTGRRDEGVTPCLSEHLAHNRVHPSQINSGVSCNKDNETGKLGRKGGNYTL